MKIPSKKVGAVLFSILLLGLVEAYLLENKLSLIIHLRNCNYPNEIENLRIEKKLNPKEIFSHCEVYSTATFSLKKKILKKWLLSSEFEVLSYFDKATGLREFVRHNEKIPLKILNGEQNFSFQFKHSNDGRTVLQVKSLKTSELVNFDVYYTTI